MRCCSYIEVLRSFCSILDEGSMWLCGRDEAWCHEIATYESLVKMR